MELTYKLSELPILKDDGLPPKAYYRISEAADILGTTTDALIHYGATRRLEIVVPPPENCWAEATNIITKETNVPFLSPTLLVLAAEKCEEIEFYGHTAVCSFRSGYELWGKNVMRCDPFEPQLDEEGSVINPEESRHWEYLLHGREESTTLFINDSSCLFVMAEELRRFKAGGKRERPDVDLEKKQGNVGLDKNKPDQLAALNQAFWKFWANANQEDKATHPKNTDVAAWLETKKFTPTLAKKAASIIRPEWASVGRKPDE